MKVNYYNNGKRVSKTVYRSNHYIRKTVDKWKYSALVVYATTTTLALVFSAFQTIQKQTLNEHLSFQVQAAQEKEISIAQQVGFALYFKEIETQKVVYETPKTIEEKIRATFPEDPDTAIAIAKCESGMNPKAFNGNNSNGSIDSGLMQINSVHGVSKHMLMDVDVNLAVARVVYERAGNSFNPWVCYKKSI